MEDAGTVSEDDGLPRSPPDISTLHEVLTDSPSKVQLVHHFSDLLHRKNRIRLRRGKAFLFTCDKTSVPTKMCFDAIFYSVFFLQSYGI